MPVRNAAIVLGHRLLACLALGFAATAAVARGDDGRAGTEPTTTRDPAAVPNLRVAGRQWLVSGQPGPGAWTGLADRGVATVINLRPDDELAGRDERAEVLAAGMAYHAVPVADASGLTADTVARVWHLLEAAEGTVLLHCASGNRAGALLALGAAQEGGMAPPDALTLGRAAGLSSAALEAEVRRRLGLPAE